jgi:hypothetical protein
MQGFFVIIGKLIFLFMNGVTLFETPAILELIQKITILNERVEAMHLELRDRNKYLNSKEAAGMMGFSEVWICNNKQHIGYSNIRKSIRFKVSDIEAYMEQNYFKTKRRK